MRKSLAALAAGVAGLLAAGLMAMTGPTAYATETEAPAVCATWKMRGATGAYPNVDFGGAPAGSSVGATSARLVKPVAGEGEDPLVQPGVEFAAKDVDVEVAAGTKVTVSYELGGSASFAAGAVRLFGYTETGADTLADAPDWQDVATGAEGTLSFTVTEPGTVGTLGLVYDASNDAKGSVTFSQLKIGERLVRFEGTCVSTSASASASASASVSASASASVSTSARPSTGATAGPDTSPGLPVTGPSMGVLIGIGLAVVASGLLLTVLVRRRKVDFRA